MTQVFWGELSVEIPLVLRMAFLVGMVYPYLFTVPTASGLLKSFILTATWLVCAYMAGRLGRIVGACVRMCARRCALASVHKRC